MYTYTLIQSKSIECKKDASDSYTYVADIGHSGCTSYVHVAYIDGIGTNMLFSP